MRGEHVNIEVANTMLGPSSYFHVRVFSLSFHTSMMTYVTDIASELLPCKSSGGGSVHFLVRRPSFTFSPEIGRKRLPCKPAGFSILTSTVKGRGVDRHTDRQIDLYLSAFFCAFLIFWLRNPEGRAVFPES